MYARSSIIQINVRTTYKTLFSISRNRITPGAPGSTNYDVDLSPVNNETIADDVLLLLREAIKDVQRRKHRPEIISGSGEGSASGEGRKKLYTTRSSQT